MTLIDHARPRPSSRRSRLAHASRARVDLASQGIVATYLRDISAHHPRRQVSSGEVCAERLSQVGRES
jgi:hypothetical protein